MANEDVKGYWGKPVGELVHDLRRRREMGEQQFNLIPINFALGIEPSPDIPLQQAVWQNLKSRLTDSKLNNQFVDLPNNLTPQEASASTVINFGNGHWDSLGIKTVSLYRSLKVKPKPLFMFVNTVPELPEPIDFHKARRQLVRGPGNNAVIFEGDPDSSTIRRALWISMQRNHVIIDGTEEDIYNDVIFRLLTHNAIKFVTNKGDYLGEEGSILSWSDWVSSPVHQEIWERAQALASAKLIENQVELEDYAPWTFVKFLQFAMDRSPYGESMRGAYRPELGVFVVTRSGGGKVDWEPDPYTASLVPVSHITEDGYKVVIPGGGNVRVRGGILKYPSGSVETFESGLITIAYQLAQEGIVHNFPEFVNWFNENMKRRGQIPIKQSKRQFQLNLDHIHWSDDPALTDPTILETNHPDWKYFPNIDLSCGSENAAFATVSALFQSSTFNSPGPEGAPLREKVIGVKLPGHGMVFVAETSDQITNAILKGMKPIEPPSV